jgi:heptosyltransferase-3/putative inorganic carbon (HCO3(-)) transporter
MVLHRNEKDSFTCHMLTTLLLGTVVLCAYAIDDFLVRGGTWRDRSIRAGAPFSDYNWLSTYMVVAVPFIVATLAVTPVWWKRIFCTGVLLLALLAQLTSYTRAGWIGMVIQGMSVGFFTACRRVALGVLVCGLLLGVGLVAVSQLGYQRDTVDPWTLTARLDVWKLELGDVMAHPLVGVGYGSETFMKRFAAYPETARAGGPHSAFLMVAMGSGIPAVAFLVWIFVGSVRALVRSAKTTTDPQRYALLVAVAIMIIGFATRNLFDYMFAGSLAYLFWILVALGFAQTAKAEGKADMPG